MAKKLNAHDRLIKLYELYEQKMYVVAYSILKDRWQAEDAVSEAFIRIMKNMDKLKDVESDRTKRFIIRVIRSTAIDTYRKNQRESKFTVITNEEEQFPDTDDPIDTALKELGSKEQVNQILAPLPEIYREVLVYRCIHEFSVKETAAVLEISESLVRKRYERARTMLMKRLGGEEYEYRVI